MYCSDRIFCIGKKPTSRPLCELSNTAFESPCISPLRNCGALSPTWPIAVNKCAIEWAETGGLYNSQSLLCFGFAGSKSAALKFWQGRNGSVCTFLRSFFFSHHPSSHLASRLLPSKLLPRAPLPPTPSATAHRTSPSFSMLGLAPCEEMASDHGGEVVESLFLEGSQHSSNLAITQEITIVACLFFPLFALLQLGLIFCVRILQQTGPNENMASETLASASVYHNNTTDRADRPDRPIRPLPKRRLRERLSPEVADSIKYPPAPQSTPALFSYPCNLKGGFLEDESSSGGRDFQPEYSGRQTSRRNGNGVEGELDEVTPRRTVVARPPTESLGRPARLLQKPETSRQGHSPQPPPSAASSADGYDSFENTNNKKKRKIPTAGEMNGAHGLGDHGLNDAHSLPGGLAVTPDRPGENGNSTSVPYYGSGSFVSAGQNISGPGRGRFGRARNGRSPLQTLSDASGIWLGRGTKSRSATWSPQPGKCAHVTCFDSVKSDALRPPRVLGHFICSLSFAETKNQYFSAFRIHTDVVFVLKRKARASFLTRLRTQKNLPRPKARKTPASSNSNSL